MKRIKRKINILTYKKIKEVKQYANIYEKEDLPIILKYFLISIMLFIALIYLSKFHVNFF